MSVRRQTAPKRRQRKPRVPHRDTSPRCARALRERCARRPGHAGACRSTWYELYDQSRAALAELVVSCIHGRDLAELKELARSLTGILHREPVSDAELERHAREHRKRTKATLERLRAGGDEAKEAQVQELLASLKAALPALEALQADCRGHWVEEDLVYRLYHHSFKAYALQDWTERIVTTLKALAPSTDLNADFLAIVGDGTGRRFQMADNTRWLTVARPIAEAYFHARYFLDMAVAYGRSLEQAPTMLPSGWAGFLYLYNLR